MVDTKVEDLPAATPVAGDYLYIVDDPAGSPSGKRISLADVQTLLESSGFDADTVDGSEAAALLARANHTGSQTASTISDFDTQVRTSRLDQMAAPTSSVSANSQNITGLAAATANGHAVRYEQLVAVAINEQTGTTYELVLADAAKLIRCNNASAFTLTVPPNSSVAFPTGCVVSVSQAGAGQVTVAPGSGVTLNKPSTHQLKTATQYAQLTLVKTATDTWLVGGHMAAV